MAPLTRLPVFLALDGRRAIVAGGSAAAAWKAELLSSTGARVAVYATTASAELLAVAADPPGGAITIHRRGVSPQDCAGAALAIGAIEDDAEAARFAVTMRAAGVPVNVVDKPQLSDFTFGAIVNRSPLVIGISSGGAAPVFAQEIRARLERFIPRGFAGWAQAASAWRPRVNALGLASAGKKLFWRKFAGRAAARPDHQPVDADLAELIAETRDDARTVSTGSVVLVDAGPGVADLITLRGLRALQSADVILVDPGVAADILDFARREARKMMVCATATAGETRTTMLTFAKAGRRVVRLGCRSSPVAYDRDIAACRAAGVAVEVVPGVFGPAGVETGLTAAE
ncbi:MAG: NAD(P)-dependent oxidoreductase [Xanthobacteraceae bacterium]|jgi:uroporphyrin-III C-methyltransferase/precorrin-2 dehydrogenase/sirohydrochlorin ferrochelatase